MIKDALIRRLLSGLTLLLFCLSAQAIRTDAYIVRTGEHFKTVTVTISDPAGGGTTVTTTDDQGSILFIYSYQFLLESNDHIVFYSLMFSFYVEPLIVQGLASAINQGHGVTSGNQIYWPENSPPVVNQFGEFVLPAMYLTAPEPPTNHGEFYSSVIKGHHYSTRTADAPLASPNLEYILNSVTGIAQISGDNFCITQIAAPKQVLFPFTSASRSAGNSEASDLSEDDEDELSKTFSLLTVKPRKSFDPDRDNDDPDGATGSAQPVNRVDFISCNASQALSGFDGRFQWLRHMYYPACLRSPREDVVSPENRSSSLVYDIKWSLFLFRLAQ